MTTTLPTHAGATPLEFREEIWRPGRASRDPASPIQLPLRDDMCFHPLRGGDQFLLSYGPNAGNWLKNTAFFGGTDEAPFITAIDPVPLLGFIKDGEKGFFESLVPSLIFRLSREFPDAPIRRQGDVWSLKLPLAWQELADSNTPWHDLPKGLSRRDRKKMMSLLRKQRNVILEINHSQTSALWNTNHRLTGHFVRRKSLCVGTLSLDGEVIVVEGRLTAPDHADQELADGPHVLARTPHIATIPLMNGD